VLDGAKGSTSRLSQRSQVTMAIASRAFARGSLQNIWRSSSVAKSYAGFAVSPKIFLAMGFASPAHMPGPANDAQL